MGLLDGLLGQLAGAALGGGAASRSPFGASGGGGQAELLRIVLSMLAGGAGGGARSGAIPAGGGLDGMLGQVLGGALGGGGAVRMAPQGAPGGIGGLEDLMARFQQAGLGGKVDSWIGTGENQPISPGELDNVLGADSIDRIAQQVGMSRDDTAGHLSELLPQVLDRLTPQGRVPEGGLGGLDDLLGQLMRR